MNNIYVGIGAYAVSNDPSVVIRTIGLGSCVGITIYHPKLQVAGLLHVALPESIINPIRAMEKPGVFADTGIPILLQEMAHYGVNGHLGLIVKLAGGANILDANQVFNIGKRNQLAVKKVLWSHRLGALSEDLGGEYSRTMNFEVATGRVTLSSPGRTDWEL